MLGKGLPTIQGVIILFDYESGEPKAMIDGTSVTGLRTAAASALATQILARPEAKTLGIFGAGLQAETHVDAITALDQGRIGNGGSYGNYFLET